MSNEEPGLDTSLPQYIEGTPFVLRNRLGHGGLGNVYLATYDPQYFPYWKTLAYRVRLRQYAHLDLWEEGLTAEERRRRLTERLATLEKRYGGRPDRVRELLDEAGIDYPEGRCAVKVFRDRPDWDRRLRKRFLDEMTAPAILTDDRLVRIYDSGESTIRDAQERRWRALWFAMEYLEDIVENPLEHLQNRHRNYFDAMLHLCHLFREMAQAFQYIHSCGIVHRDIKPRNVVVHLRNGVEGVKVMDFGIAKFGGPDRTGPAPTMSGESMGTPRFMSPEHLQAKDCDERSDVYSLGATFYTYLAGVKPYEQCRPDQIVTNLSEGYHAVPLWMLGDFPRVLSDIIDRMMSLDPDQRFRSMEEVAAALESPFAYRQSHKAEFELASRKYIQL